MIVAANKIDALDDPDRLERLEAHLQRPGIPLYPVSAATGEGLPLLLEAVWRQARAVPSIHDRNDDRRSAASASSAARSIRFTAAIWPRRRRPRARSISTARARHAVAGTAAPSGQPVASAFHRFAMAALASRRTTAGRRRRRTASSAAAVISPPTRSSACTPPGSRASQIFFITGADAFAEIRDVEPVSGGPRSGALRRRVAPGSPPRRAGGAAAGAAIAMRTAARRTDAAGRRPRFFLLDGPTPDVSSTDRRRRLAGARLRVWCPARRNHIINTALRGRSSRRQTTCMAKTERTPAKAPRTKKLTGEIAKAVRPRSTRRRSTSSCSICGTRRRSPISSCSAPGRTAAGAGDRGRDRGGAARREGAAAHVEGYDRAEWVLMDFFTFIVHVFTPQTREFYSLERLWGDAERIEVATNRQAAAGLLGRRARRIAIARATAFSRSSSHRPVPPAGSLDHPTRGAVCGRLRGGHHRPAAPLPALPALPPLRDHRAAAAIGPYEDAEGRSFTPEIRRAADDRAAAGGRMRERAPTCSTGRCVVPVPLHRSRSGARLQPGARAGASTSGCRCSMRSRDAQDTVAGGPAGGEAAGERGGRFALASRDVRAAGLDRRARGRREHDRRDAEGVRGAAAERRARESAARLQRARVGRRRSPPRTGHVRGDASFGRSPSSRTQPAPRPAAGSSRARARAAPGRARICRGSRSCGRPPSRARCRAGS